MRWPIIKQPVVGEVRHLRKFAFWPTRCDDGYMYWFEYIIITERFNKAGAYDDNDYWAVQKCYPESKYLMNE